MNRETKPRPFFFLAAGIVAAIAFCGTQVLYAGWEISNPFTGVTYSKLRDDDVHPILGWSTSPLDVDVMEIDLSATGISFTSTPSNGDGFGETDRQTTMDFMLESETEIAINTVFYSFETNDCLGLVYSDGDLVSSFSPSFPSINISPDNMVELITTSAADNIYPYGNAFSGNIVIVENGVPVDDQTTERHPRTAAGYNALENKLILMTVDGRSTESIGVRISELGTLMANFGATWAVNLDGGGSTQMTTNATTPAYVNTPSETYRAVAANLGVHAVPDDTFQAFADFEHNNKATFEYSPGYSGSSFGFVEGSSYTELVDSRAGAGQGSLKVEITDDASATGEWFARIVSGASATRSQNVVRESGGYVGLMARTSDPGNFISLAIDDPYTGDRGLRQELIADDRWHWYEWDMEDDSQWEAWISAGNGTIDGTDFTLDSVQIWGTDTATVYLDQIAHCSTGTLVQPPVAADDFYSLNEDQSLAIAADGVLSNDFYATNNPFQAVRLSDPQHGTLELNSDGSLSYVPEANWNGTDSFTYKANDGLNDSNVATVTLVVDSINDIPVAAGDTYAVVANGLLKVSAEDGLLANDFDVDSENISARWVTLTEHGTLWLYASDGHLNYLPDENFVGWDSFEYRVYDGEDYSNTVVCNILVGLMGDANMDGTVDAGDAQLLAANWRMASGATWSDGDFNGDGAVNDKDATLLAANWLRTVGPPSAVPEPGVFVPIAGMFLMGLFWPALSEKTALRPDYSSIVGWVEQIVSSVGLRSLSWFA